MSFKPKKFKPTSVKPQPKEITIDIDENGDPTFSGQGFTGTECVTEMLQFEEALGVVGEREYTDEYSEAPKQLEKKKQQRKSQT